MFGEAVNQRQIPEKAILLEYQSDLILKTAHVTQFLPNKPLKGYCAFKSVGKLPVIVDSSYTFMTFTTKKDIGKYVTNPMENIFNKFGRLKKREIEYKPETNEYTDLFKDSTFIDESVMDSALKGEFFILYAGKIIYENPINRGKRYLMFAVIIPPIEGLSVHTKETFIELYMKNGDLN